MGVSTAERGKKSANRTSGSGVPKAMRISVGVDVRVAVLVEEGFL